MYKSEVFTFGFLLSSLVMLVLVPFLNNNSFLSNPAMAQEYDKYQDSSYSQYPTDDKKYECRTGPFEGFFVSSVEFCKHIKFDDRKDNDRKDNNMTEITQEQEQSIPQNDNITTINDNDMDIKSNGHSQKVSYPSYVSYNPGEEDEKKVKDFMNIDHLAKVKDQ